MNIKIVIFEVFVCTNDLINFRQLNFIYYLNILHFLVYHVFYKIYILGIVYSFRFMYDVIKRTIKIKICDSDPC